MSACSVRSAVVCIIQPASCTLYAAHVDGSSPSVLTHHHAIQHDFPFTEGVGTPWIHRRPVEKHVPAAIVQPRVHRLYDLPAFRGPRADDEPALYLRCFGCAAHGGFTQPNGARAVPV